MTADTIKVYCEDPGVFHERQGRSWIETFERMPDPGLDGATRWRSREQKRSRRPRSEHVLDQMGGREHGVRETVLSADGLPLNDLDRRNTRSRQGAVEAGKIRARTSDPSATDEQVQADAESYADSLTGHRITYTLTCRCGLSLRARGERLGPILDTLAAGGMDELSLRQIKRVYSH